MGDFSHRIPDSLYHKNGGERAAPLATFKKTGAEMDPRKRIKLLSGLLILAVISGGCGPTPTHDITGKWAGTGHRGSNVEIDYQYDFKPDGTMHATSESLDSGIRTHIESDCTYKLSRNTLTLHPTNVAEKSDDTATQEKLNAAHASAMADQTKNIYWKDDNSFVMAALDGDITFARVSQ